MSEREKFWHDYYGQLDGAKIVRFLGMMTDEFGFGEGFPAFEVVTSAGEHLAIEISQDPEGNGGGFIFGLPVVTNA